MAAALTSAPYRSMNTPFKQGCLIPLVINIGAAGAPTLNVASVQTVTVVGGGGTGIYTVTNIPTGARGCVLGEPCIVAVDGTALNVAQMEAFSATAGTATINTYAAAGTTEADPPSGAQIHVCFLVEGG